ncbi:MAG TPA: hypothetical protein VHG28_20325 [Longimicrobiaceae bacterium]|nr:hypothetical protein [Longimicrobiaceae bacterium]
MKRILTIAILLLAPVTLGAQGTGDAAQRIEAAKRRAEAVGVPVGLLESKVAEGRAKGVPLDRIAVAVENRLALLVRAREAMGAGVTAADLSVGADALMAGVSGESLAALTRTAPADRRAVAIAVLTQLVQQGEASERALERVRLALADPEALRSLPGERRGGPPDRERPGLAQRGDAPRTGPPTSIGTPGRPGLADATNQTRRPPRGRTKP